MITNKSIVIIGERGLVSQLLQVAIKTNVTPYNIDVISTSQFLGGWPHPILDTADLVILCVDLTKTKEVLDRIPNDKKVLDISPTFRCDPKWTYGLEEIVGAYNISSSQYVANPGCFATAAILLLEPVVKFGCYRIGASFYLDGTGGYTTGGTKMIEKYESSAIPDTVYSLSKEHLHIAEIKKMSGLEDMDVVFTPKIANVPGGIRMAIYIPGAMNTQLMTLYKDKYERFSNIRVDEDGNYGLGKIPVDEMAGRTGATIRVYNHDTNDGALAVLTMDNLLRGCIEPAMNNIHLMMRR